MTRKAPIGLVGLGLMGNAIAGRLLAAQYPVVGYDIDASRRNLLERLGGESAGGCQEVVARADRILLSLPTTDVVEGVVAAMGDALSPGKTLIDTTTGSPEQVENLGRRLATREVDYLDATISGSSAQTARGEVIVVAGGPQAAFDRCADVFRTFASRTFRVGPWGSGTRMKLVTNLVLGLNRAALAEGLSLAEAMGLDGDMTLAILAESAAYSRAMDAKGRKMIERDFAPQAKLSQHLKDVRLILDQAPAHEVTLPLSTVHRELLERLEAAGLGDADNSAIIQAFGRPPPATDPPQE